MRSQLLSVATVEELQGVWVSPLGNGSVAYVLADDQLYTLNKEIGGSPVGSVTPLPGAPIAGAPDARWLAAVFEVAPTVEDAEIFAAAPADVVTPFSENVTIIDITGFSITGLGAPNIVAVSGSGTSTLTFELDAPAIGGENWVLEWDATNTVEDLTGTPLAPGSMPITLVGVFAPLVESATIEAVDPTIVEVDFNEVVTILNVTGFSVSGVGAPNIVNVTGTGTTTLKFELDAPALGGETWTLDWDGTNTVEDLNGDPLAPGSEPIVLSGDFSPKVQSATIFAVDPFFLDVPFNEAVTILNTDGFSITGVGAPGIVGVTGSGTSTLQFELDASPTGGEAWTLEWDGTNTVEDLSGDPLLPGTEPIVLDGDFSNLAAFNALATWTRLYLRTTGGPSETAGTVTGWPEANGGAAATLAGAGPVYRADPLGNGSGPSADLESGDAGFETGVGLATASSWTQFIIIRPQTLSGYSTFIADTTGDQGSLYALNTEVALWQNGTTDVVGDIVAVDTIYRIIIACDGANYFIYFNGALVANPARGSSFTWTSEFGSTNGGDFAMLGDIFACGVCNNEALTGADATELDELLQREIAGT